MDLHLGNILIKYNNNQDKSDIIVKVTDYGLALEGKNPNTNRQIFNTVLRPPELLIQMLKWSKDKSFKMQITNKVDIWAMGVLIYKMLNPRITLFGLRSTTFGLRVFECLREIERVFGLQDNQKQNIGKLPKRNDKELKIIPNEYADLLIYMMNTDPDKRPSAEDIIKYLLINFNKLLYI
jgi:serine/threonine protein kinase